MAAIRPEALDAAGPINPATDVLILDQGAGGVRKTVPNDIIGAARPLASQAEAEAGTDNANTMTPLRTAQAIEAIGPDLFASLAQGALADSAVQPDRAITAGTGLTGGGSLASDVAIALDAASIASLALADSALQPGEGGTLPLGGPTAFALVKDSPADNDVSWQQVGDMRGTVYDPTGVGTAVSMFGDKAFRLARVDASTSSLMTGFDKVIADRWSATSDLAPAVYFRAAAEPAHGLKFQDASGAWFERIDSEIDVRSTGVLVNTTYSPSLGSANRLAIQRAIDYCEYRSLNGDVRGGKVILPAGEVQVSSISNVCVRMKSNVWLQGAGKSATILKVGPNQVGTAHIVNHIGVLNAKISDICVDGNRINQADGIGGHGIRVGGSALTIGCDGLTVRDVEIRNCSYGVGLQDGAVMNVLIDNCWIHGTYRDAVDIKDYPTTIGGVTYPGQNIVLRNCLIENWGLSSALDDQNGIHTRSQKTQIIGCTFKPTGGGCAIYLSATSSQGPTGAINSIVRDNIIYLPDPAVGGVNMSGIKCYANNVNIEGNSIFSGQRGIRIAGNYCNLTNNLVSLPTSFGIFASSDGANPTVGPKDLTAVGNVMIGNGSGSGFYLSSDGGARIYGGFIGGWGTALDVVSGTLNGLCNSVNFGTNTNQVSGIGSAVRMINCNGYKTTGEFQSATFSVAATGPQTITITHDLAAAPSLIRSSVYLFGGDTNFIGTARLSAVSTTTVTAIVDITVAAAPGTNARVGATLRTATA